MTQAELGKMTGLSQDFIGRLERGLENISVENLVKLSIPLNIEPSLLLVEDYCRDDNKNTKNSNGKG